MNPLCLAAMAECGHKKKDSKRSICSGVDEDVDFSIVEVSLPPFPTKKYPQVSKELSQQHLCESEDALKQIMGNQRMGSRVLDSALSALAQVSSQDRFVCPSSLFLNNMVEKVDFLENMAAVADGSNWTEHGGFWSPSCYMSSTRIVYVALVRESWVAIGIDRGDKMSINIFVMGPFPEDTGKPMLFDSYGKLSEFFGEDWAAFVRAVCNVDEFLGEYLTKPVYLVSTSAFPYFQGNVCGLLALNAARGFVDPGFISKTDLLQIRINFLELFMVGKCDSAAHYGERRGERRGERKVRVGGLTPGTGGGCSQSEGVEVDCSVIMPIMPDAVVLRVFEVRSSRRPAETFQMLCEQQAVYTRFPGGVRKFERGDVQKRMMRLQLWDGAQWQEVGTALLTSDNWDKGANLGRWSPTFTRGGNSDMRIHHIFITAMLEYFRRTHVKALISEGRFKRMNDPIIPTFDLVFDLDARCLFEDATAKDLTHLRKWAKRTSYWDEYELVGNGMGGWKIPTEIDEAYATVCNYRNPRAPEETVTIYFPT